MTNRKRQPIPEPIKRQLRQEAGFGCCKCGNPIFQYHHIVRDAAEAKDLMILCPNCHNEATAGAMVEEEQRRYKLEPVNIQTGYVEGQLKINQTEPAISVGSVLLVGDGSFIMVDDEDLLSLGVDASGIIKLTVQLYDHKDNLVASIKDNEWVSGDPYPWDLESKYQWLRIHSEPRRITLEVDTRTFPIEIHANLWRKGQNFEIDPYQIRFDGVVKNVGVSNLCLVGLRLVADTSSNVLRISTNPRFGEGVIISWPDPVERVQKGLEAWKKIKEGLS